MVNTPFNYTGSKFKLLEQILPYFDYKKKTFVDLFVGGGSVYTNVIDKFDKIVINDIINELVEIHRGLLNDEKFVDRVRAMCVAKDDQAGYHVLRDNFNKARLPEQLFALMLCCTNNLMRFNKSFGFNQTFGKRTFNPSTAKKIKEFQDHVGPHRGKIGFASLHFTNVLFSEPSMVYIDPPYGLATDGSFISEAGYNAYWTKSDDELLYHHIHKIMAEGHSFVLSGLLEHDGKTSWLLSRLIGDGFAHKVLEKNYEKVARNKNKNSVEVIVMGYN